jgi:DNA-binding protein
VRAAKQEIQIFRDRLNKGMQHTENVKVETEGIQSNEKEQNVICGKGRGLS